MAAQMTDRFTWGEGIILIPPPVNPAPAAQ